MTTRILSVWRAATALTVGLALAGAALVVPTAAVADATVPVPDVLDVSFSTAGPVESHRATPTIIGTPTYAVDATVKRPVATFNAASGVRYAMDTPWNASNPNNILNTATVECTFRYDGVAPATATNAFCSGRQTGGYSIDVSGANIRFVVGATVIATAPVTAGQWNHVVGTFDGTTGKIYVNGVFVAQGTKSTANAAPAALFWFVGGDTKAAGAIESAATGAVATSRIWSSTLTADQVATLYAQDTAVPSIVPDADILDVDFASGTPVDAAQGRAATVIGAPAYSTDPALDRTVASFNGASGIRYPFSDPWDASSAKNIINAVSIECVFRFDGSLPAAANNSACSGRQTGGYTIDISGSDIRFIIGGTVVVKIAAQSGLWYHAVGTYDGTTAKLYLNGALAGTFAKTGATAPPTGRFWVIGADTNATGGLEFYGSVTVASARIWSEALSLEQVQELNLAALGDQDSGVELISTVPAAAANLTKPTRFQITVENQGAASGWKYLLDGKSIQPGQSIGAGMRAGAHSIVITATDLFGKAINWTVPFSSATIPMSGGTETAQGNGQVTLSAAATDPDGGKVTTEFEQSTASIANGGFQGVVPVAPSTLEFAYTDSAQVDGLQAEDDSTADSASSHDQIPFQRFDVQVPATGDDRRVQWSGTVDPERTVTVSAWSVSAAKWVELATSRGTSDGDTVLVGEVTESVVDNGVVHVLVTGEDPFADDLAARDASAGTSASKDHFENPDDYDFSFVHWSDPQYLSEGATGGSDKWPASVDFPTSSGVQTPEEQAVWGATVKDSMQWIADNADERKIAYVGNTGDLINNNYYLTNGTNPDGSPLYPGLNEQVAKEFAFIRNAYAPVADSGIPNQVLAGNHDNELGLEIGSDSRYSQTFSAGDWYDAAGDWSAGAEYHAWDETTNADGTVASEGGDNQNSYVLFSAGGLDFVSVSLSYGVTQAEVDWANSVFERYKDRNGIISTHGYMGYSLNKDGRGSPLADDGNLLYDQVVSANPNIVLVLAGHRHGSGINLKTLSGTDSTHKVVELLSDYQAYLVPASNVFDAANCPTCVFGTGGTIDVDGDGVIDHQPADKLIVGSSFMRLLQFDTEASTVSVDSYSPFLDEFGPTKYDPLSRYNGAEENFTVPIDLTSRTTSFSTDALTVVTPSGAVIGTATAKSGWPATVTWTGLAAGTTYAWSASSRNAAGENLGSVEQYGGVFVAGAAGTDTTPPVITVPSTATVQQNAAFDAMVGVTALDNADGDLTSQVQVVSTVDTAAAGTYTVLYSVSDANGNTAQATRSVRVLATPVPELTPTSITASNVTVTFGEGATLMATVSPANSTGTVQFSNGEDVLCKAPVINGSATCAVAILPPPGTYAIETLYSGDTSHALSERSFVLVVKSNAAPADTRLGITSNPTISGTPSVGSTLSAVPATFTGSPTAVVGQWLANGQPIAGATATTLVVDADTVGTAISYRSVASKPGVDSLTSTSAAVGPVSKAVGAKPKLTITKKPTSKAAGKATVSVSKATGKVTVTLTSGSKTKKVKGSLKNGKVTVTLPKLSKGTWKLGVSYAGSPSFTSSKGSTVSLKVK